jgi:hypothetical protein
MIGQMANKVNAILNRSTENFISSNRLQFLAPKQLPLVLSQKLVKARLCPFLYTLFLINNMQQSEIDVHKSNPQLLLFC